MTSRESNILFDDIFTITGIDVEGKKFDRGPSFPPPFHHLLKLTFQPVHAVSRLVATSESHGMHLALDFNHELYPLSVGSRFTFALASSLLRAGDTETEDARNIWRPDNKGRQGIERDYDYVMYGKVSP